MSRDLNGYIVKVVLIEVCIREINCLKFWKPFSFWSLALSANVGLVPHQSQVYEAGAVFTQGTDLNSLELGEVETDQGLTVSREDGGEGLEEKFGVRAVGVIWAEMQLSEMINIKEAETGGWGDVIRQHNVDMLHLRTELHRHCKTLITTTVPGIKRPEL